ncbi:MAG: sarcosine oxidase subunit gamma family protein, partial [Kiloniellales bacterium]
MAEFQRQGPLDGLSLQQRAVAELGEAGVGIGEIRYEGAVNLRARRDDPQARDALTLSLGMALPATGGTARRDEQVLLGLGPDEWLLLCSKAPQTAESLDQSLASQFVAITDLSDNFTTLFVRGPRALDLLAKGIPIDLDPEIFPPGRCAQTLMSKAEVILYRGVADWSESYMLLCRPSFAQYVFTWLQDAAQEYGLVI